MSPAKTPNHAILEQKNPQLEQKIWLDLGMARFLKTQVKRRGAPSISLEYGTYRGNPSLPGRVLFFMPQKKTRVSWIYLSRDLKKTFNIKQFQQKAPPNVRVQVLP